MSEERDRRLAELDAARAEAGESQALLERDVVAGIALNEAAGRAVAENAAVESSIRANSAEAQTRAVAASASLAQQEASHERAAASNASFGAILMAVLLAGALVVLGYFLWWQPSRSEGTNTTIIRTDRNTTVAAPAPAPAPNPNLTINVKPPDVNVQVAAPPAPASTPQESAPPESGSAEPAKEGPSESGSGSTSP